MIYIKITHYNQQFKTSVYSKPTFSGVFAHYESYLDETHNKSLVDNLWFRCFPISSDYTLFHLKVENLIEVLKKNSQLSRVIEQSIRYFQRKLHVPKKVIPTVPKTELLIVTPHLGTMSSYLKRKWSTCFKNSLPQCNIKIFLKTTNCRSSLFRFKDIIPKNYSLTCKATHMRSNCNVKYCGKTDRHLNVRSSEHVGIWYLIGKRVECKIPAVSDHLLLHNHDSDFNDFTLLYRNNNGFKLLLKQSILIYTDSPVFNKNTNF